MRTPPSSAFHLIIEPGAPLETATAGPRTVPVRSSIAGGKAQECSRPPRPSDVLRAGTARAPVAQGQTPETADASGVRSYVLPLPGDVSILRAIPGEAPAVHAEPLETPQHELILEPVLRLESMFRLVLVNPTTRKLRVNGERAPRVSLLREMDQFHWDDSCVFHVTIFHQPQIGPADSTHRPCPICLAPFSDDPNALCYRCVFCGTVLHLKDPTGLECARAVNACPTCKQKVMLKNGYTWLPEFCHE